MNVFPFFHTIEGKTFLIVGGGRVAAEKVGRLLPFGADMHIVGKWISEDLREMVQTYLQKDEEAAEGSFGEVLSGEETYAAQRVRIRLEERPFEERDLDDADYCIAAVDDDEVSRRIHDLCVQRKIPVNVVDNRELCEFLFPSLIRRGDLTVAVSTAGKSPAMARYIKKQVEAVLPSQTEAMLERLGALRSVLPAYISSQWERSKAYAEILTLLTETENRATEEEVQQIIRRHADRRICVLATRGSALALAQAETVGHLLEEKGLSVELRIVSTGGDRDRTRPLSEIGGKGLFVKDVERELLEGHADIAVHSGKDLPYELAEGTVIAGVPAAESACDCLLTRKGEQLPERPVIGTGSPRRIVQCRKYLPHAVYESIRGNVDTRLKKLREGTYDGILLARAGLNRLQCDLSDLTVHEFSPEEFVPAACQGILAVQCREEDTELCRVLKEISDPVSERRFRAERHMLCLTGADCTQSVGAHASLQGDRLTMRVLLGEREAVESDDFGNYAALCRRLLGEISDKELRGSVTLVGAGCGPDLITVRGLRAVRQAEVLLYDDLLDSGILEEAPAFCEKIYVGKRSGRHSAEQETIHQILIEKARAGRHVVRLKGGDGYVFGRGGEEILALQEAGIPYEVIPGVTSAVAVPGHAGIPVTHRGIAQSFTVVTGHSATDTEENYETLAGLKGTLVFLMGLQRAARIAEKLMACGKPADTPAAIVSQGFSAGEKRITGTLADIGEKAVQAAPPAVLVVGPTADFHLEPTIRRPLDGISVTLAGTERFIRKLARLLEKQGAETDLRPVLKIRMMPENIPEDLSTYSWIVFTSAQGVKAFFEKGRPDDASGPADSGKLADSSRSAGKSKSIDTGGAADNGADVAKGKNAVSRKRDIRELSGLRFACIGEGTEEELCEYGICADFTPSVYTARALGRELPALLGPEDHVLILRAENGSPELTEELERADVRFTDAAIYRTEPDPAVFDRPAAATNYLVFASAAGVRTWFRVQDLPEGTLPVCIGPSTEKELRQHTNRLPLTAEVHTAEGIVELLVDAVRRGAAPAADSSVRG